MAGGETSRGPPRGHAGVSVSLTHTHAHLAVLKYSLLQTNTGSGVTSQAGPLLSWDRGRCKSVGNMLPCLGRANTRGQQPAAAGRGRGRATGGLRRQRGNSTPPRLLPPTQACHSRRLGQTSATKSHTHTHTRQRSRGCWGPRGRPEALRRWRQLRAVRLTQPRRCLLPGPSLESRPLPRAPQGCL